MNVIKLTQGEILYDPNFQYSDAKQPCDKLLLVLNRDHGVLEDVVVVPCTSGADTTGLSGGCNPDEKVFFVNSKIGYYDPPTVVQFEFIRHLDGADVVDWIDKGYIHRQHKSLSAQELGQILNCLKKVKEDIPTIYYDMIFP